jgi:subtilisin family serine protease
MAIVVFRSDPSGWPDAGTGQVGAEGSQKHVQIGKDTFQRDPGVDAMAPAEMPVRLLPQAEAGGRADAQPSPGPTWGIRAVRADACPFTGHGVKVAVLDTGIDMTHPAFAGVKFNVHDFTGEGIEDKDGHGTMCAAIIFGREVAGVRVGVAPGVTDVLIGKVLGRHGGTVGQVAEAVEWAYANGAHIVSMSLGIDYAGRVAALSGRAGRKIQAASQALADFAACVRLFDRQFEHFFDRNQTYRGMLAVAAAGNESVRPDYAVSVQPPGSAFAVVSVGAIDQNHAVAPFSNRSPTFCAPGVDIISARAGGGWVSDRGTSMAAPYVAGVAALWAERRMMAARGRCWPNVVLDDIRKDGIVKLPGLGPDAIGAGLVVAPAE